MDIRGVLDNAVATVTGSVAKAKIRIKDNRSRREQALNLKEMGKQKSGGLGAASALAGYASDAAGKGLEAAVKTVGVDVDTNYNRVMEVQFNPSSLMLRSYGGSENLQAANYTKDDIGITRGKLGVHTEMQVKLIFDQISNYSAFTSDMLTLSTSRAVSQAAGAIGGLIGGPSASVQMIVEAFIATMRNENTRRVCFEWGEFYYEGMLSRVNTDYTMFDLSGNPIRAEVTMVLYLVDDDLDKEFNEYWYDAYYAAFIEGNPTAEAMMKLLEKGKMLS